MPSNNLDINVRAQTRQAEAALRRMQGSGRGLIQWTRNLRAGLMGMNTMMMGAGAVMVGAGSALRSAARSTEEYSNAQANLRSVLVSSNISVREQQNLMRVADISATRYGIGLATTSRAMVDMSEAGFNTHEVMRYFPIATEFATAANMELADAVNMLQGSMHQFNLQSEEDARQMAGGLLVAARISSTSVEELQNAFRYAAVEAAGLGYNATEVTGALAGLSIMNLRGSIAGTRLRAVLAGLNRITQRTEEVARESGISVDELRSILYDAAGNTLPLRDAFRNLMDLFARLPNRMEQNRLAVSMFGRYGMSAGMMFANLNGQAAQWEGILDRISDRQSVANTMTAAATENMRGFGAQMRLARTAMENFGIGFGEIILGLDSSEEGFGRYLSDLSAAVRLSDENARRTGAARQQWEGFTPEIRAQGAEIREAMQGWAQLLIWVGRAIAHVGNWIGHNPQLATTLLLVGSALRPLVTQTSMWASVLPRLGGFLGNIDLLLRYASQSGSIALRVFSSLSGVFSVLGGLGLGYELSSVYGWISDLVEPTQRLGEEISRLKDRTEAGSRAWIHWVPVLGQAANFIRLIVSLIRDAVVATTSSAALRAPQLSGPAFDTNANAMIESRMARMPEGMSAEQARFRAANSLFIESVQQAAAISETQGVSNEEAIYQFRTSLQEAGMGAESIDSIMNVFVRQLQRDTETQRQLMSGLNTNFQSASRAAVQFSMAMNEARGGLPYGTGYELSPEDFGGAVPEVQDAYVRRGGIVSVADDDLIVARSELARVLSMSPGGAIPSSSPQQVGATPQSQQPAQMNTSVNFEVPVYLDGREIARAIGTQNLQTDQRRGTRTAPGSRRRVTQSGVR